MSAGGHARKSRAPLESRGRVQFGHFQHSVACEWPVTRNFPAVSRNRTMAFNVEHRRNAKTAAPVQRMQRARRLEVLSGEGTAMHRSLSNFENFPSETFGRRLNFWVRFYRCTYTGRVSTIRATRKLLTSPRTQWSRTSTVKAPL